MRKMTNKLAITSLFCILAFGGSTAFADMITLDKATQGGGNKGTSYRPVDEFSAEVNFYMTARTVIDMSSPYDPDATGQVGTIMIDDGRGDKGAGVQDINADGSKGISGTGALGDEELIFWYDQAVTLGSLSIMLRDIDFGIGSDDKDDPVIFLSLAGTGTFGVTIQETEISNAFTSTGNNRGTVDFGSFASLSGLAADTAIAAFKIRATNGHFSVTGAGTGAETGGAAIPEPSVLSLLAVGGAGLLRRKFR